MSSQQLVGGIFADAPSLCENENSTHLAIHQGLYAICEKHGLHTGAHIDLTVLSNVPDRC